MHKRMKDLISLAAKDLDDMKISWVVEVRRKHSRLIYSLAGERITTIISNTASDVRAAMNLRSNVRNEIKRRREHEDRSTSNKHHGSGCCSSQG